MHDLVWAALIAAVPATIGAIASIRNGRRGKAIESRLKDGNGDETTIGEAVYQLDKKVEVVIAQQHETKSTVAAMREEYLKKFEGLESKAKRRKA